MSINKLGNTPTQSAIQPRDASTVVVSGNDTSQKGFGDCCFISGLNSLAINNKNIIQDHIHTLGPDPQGGGDDYSVDLYKNGAWETETVTPQSVLNHGTSDPYHAYGQNGTDYGPIYEQALLQANGGSVGSTPTDSLTELVGPHVLNDDADGSNSLDAFTNGGSATASHAAHGDGWYNAQTGQFDGKTQKPGDVPILGDHCYSVQGVSGTSPNRTVIVDNPWNSGGFGGNQVSMSEAAYKAIFARKACTVDANGNPGAPPEDSTASAKPATTSATGVSATTVATEG